MIEIRATSDEVDLSGTPDELQRIRAGIEALMRNTEKTLSIAANPMIDPAPYANVLRQLRIVRGGRPTKVSVEEQALVVIGANENLSGFRLGLRLLQTQSQELTVTSTTCRAALTLIQVPVL